MERKFFHSCVKIAVALGCVTAPNTIAAPLETIPWNGHVGAVSLTFDDAMENQVLNLKPILDEMPEAHVTFFLTGSSYYLINQGGNKGFASLALAGHEIGNHSLSHGNYVGMKQAELVDEIITPADTIESLIKAGGANIKVSAFATPYCANDDEISAAISQRHFINRDCGDWGYRHSWNKEPNWFKFSALGWDRGTKTPEDLMVAMDTCIGNADFSGLNSWETPPGPEGEWMIVLHHGVADEGDNMSVSTADIRKILQHALDNKMWVAGFGTVGAYFKAHFTLDSATAISDGDGYKISWEMPHPQMPQSIPMKVKIQSDFLSQAFGDIAIRTDVSQPRIVMEQKGKVIWPDSKGVYDIEFNELSVTIRLETAADSSSRPDEGQENDTGIAPRAAARLKAMLMSDPRTVYTVFDLNGNRLGYTDSFGIPESMPRGIYIIRGENPDFPPVTQQVRH